MKHFSKLVLGALLSLNISSNSEAVQFDMFGFMNDMAAASVNNKDLTQSKVNCVLSVYAILDMNNALDNAQIDISHNEAMSAIENYGKEFFNILKNNNVNVKNDKSLLDIAYELCNTHLKNAFKEGDINTSKKILELSLEKINQEKQNMMNNFEEVKNMPSSEKKVLFNKKVMSNMMIMPLLSENNINDLQSRKKAINEFNATGDDTIKIINDILDSGISYLDYQVLYFQELAKSKYY